MLREKRAPSCCPHRSKIAARPITRESFRGRARYRPIVGRLCPSPSVGSSSDACDRVSKRTRDRVEESFMESGSCGLLDRLRMHEIMCMLLAL